MAKNVFLFSVLLLAVVLSRDFLEIEGELYTIYTRSPPVSSPTNELLTLNIFHEGGDGGGPSECDNEYRSDDNLVVALSTGWFNHESRCNKSITISANGHNVVAMVVDECDSTMGCDSDHGYRPPCRNNIVDASRAVWEPLGVPGNNRGWSDA
ncbi:hypothetical protein IFM89_000582 [Coptis chinensis]|uniref:Ripening-related protein 1 n=1 Tax=Coptis chinensis TaxID=261450 RepID=A0A835LL27_9MAGN|nr:hypothetical protein IFM89_000582 [Coptis chinensis]